MISVRRDHTNGQAQLKNVQVLGAVSGTSELSSLNVLCV